MGQRERQQPHVENIPTRGRCRAGPSSLADQEQRREAQEDEEAAGIGDRGDQHRRADRRIAAELAASSSESARPSTPRASG